MQPIPAEFPMKRVGRYKARQDALQVLYQLDMNQTLTPGAGLYHFEHHFHPEGGTVDEFTGRLVNGVIERLDFIDNLVTKHSQHWRKERMPAVDRNILRMGVFELWFCDDIPATVTINEMVELAKQFGSENTPAFINGVLDKLKEELDRPNKAK